MNKKQQLLCNVLVAVVFCTTAAFAQKKSKTYQETFNVAGDAVLEINTSHTDIEFETWDKNQVEIVATVVLEEATDEEAKEYFESEPFKILGNSKEIKISSSKRNSWAYGIHGGDFGVQSLLSSGHLGVESLLSDVEPLFHDIEIPELPEIAEFPEVFVNPPFPPLNFKEFDYDAYEKDGDKYLKQWTKEFRKNFNEEYKERFEEWGEAYQERSQERAERMEKRAKEMEERAAEREKQLQERMEVQEQRRKEIQERRQEIQKKERLLRKDRSVIRFPKNDGSNIFYFSSDGESKKYKVKKSIKIKLPKSTRIKMDVKHGEVKLAATTKNINASLRYASLLASTIEGDKTAINASYTPVVVQKWNFGRLRADYAEHVSLKQVGDLKLNAVSSNVIIDRLNDRAVVTYDFGELVINSISDKFSDIDVSVVSGDFRCKVPQTASSFYLNGTSSKIAYPSELIMDKSRGGETVIYKGHKIDNHSGKLISVNSKYGEVVLEN
ncbi:hypothetical protein MTsPCn5_38920 [Croceitalea sp. MTPC5]|uniref:hypothetical protein n=1 Tax=Croceitalea sp. MTPC5 TaxID=3056565 RepID=UPI002B3C53E0|nr:hypothetical protein MTsPCn5_38920 [Croceitalea sp. MTPC5]